jgi:hypothetical protein
MAFRRHRASHPNIPAGLRVTDAGATECAVVVTRSPVARRRMQAQHQRRPTIPLPVVSKNREEEQ